jgi:LysM repeat protein
MVTLFVLRFFECSELFASPVPVRNRYFDSDQPIAIKEAKEAINDLRHEVSNHEAEIRMLEEQLKNFDIIIDNVRDQISEAAKVQREQLKGSCSSIEARILAMENTHRGLISDLKLFKSHASEVSTVLGQYKQKIDELEKAVDQQNQNIDHLQEAMQALMDAFQVKNAPAKNLPNKSLSSNLEGTNGRTYRVKMGDNLEKIARAHQTTVQAIKGLNGLTSDRIDTGKLLQIPEK